MYYCRWDFTFNRLAVSAVWILFRLILLWVAIVTMELIFHWIISLIQTLSFLPLLLEYIISWFEFNIMSICGCRANWDISNYLEKLIVPLQNEVKEKRQRKQIDPQAHFTVYTTEGGDKRAKCNYCERILQQMAQLHWRIT